MDEAQKEAANSAIDQAESEHMAWLETQNMGDVADAVAEQNEGFSKAINGTTGKIDAMTAATNIAAGAMLGFGVFETVSGWMASLDGPLKVMVGLLLAAAGAWAIFWAFATAGIATAAGSAAAFAGVGAVLGAGSLSWLDSGFRYNSNCVCWCSEYCLRSESPKLAALVQLRCVTGSCSTFCM